MPIAPDNFKQYITDNLLDEKRLITDEPADMIIERLVNEKGSVAAKELFDTLD